MSAYPLSVVYVHNALFPQEKDYKATIRFEDKEIVSNVFDPKTKVVRTKKYEIPDEDLVKMQQIVSYEAIVAYSKKPEDERVCCGYRDGWHTNFKISFPNDIIINGVLGECYKDNPFEQLIIFVREQFPNIEVFRRL